MKSRAVIFRKDRTNDVLVPTAKKNDLTHRSFRHEEIVYFLDPERVQITWDRPWHKLWRRYYSTSYYIQGFSLPLPVPDFQKVDELILEEREVRDPKTGKIEKQSVPVIDPKTNKPRTKQVFPKAIDLGIGGEMTAQIFNPWFLRVIAAMGAKTWEKIQFILVCATLIVAVYAAWQIGQLPDAHEIARAILEEQEAARLAAEQAANGGFGAPPVVVDPGA